MAKQQNKRLEAKVENLRNQIEQNVSIHGIIVYSTSGEVITCIT